MNTEWTLAELDKFLTQTEMRRPDPVPGVVDLTGRMVTAADSEERSRSRRKLSR
jgi:hypothetical protein